MTFSHIYLPAVLLMAGIFTAPAAQSTQLPKNIQLETLDDGMQVIVEHLPEATETSLRFILKSGAKDDPLRLAGTAHLLEHLIFHGSYTDRELIFNETRQKGATINAFTSTDWTVYVLDAPLKSFEKLSTRYLKLITNPALGWADLESEKKVIDAEHQLRNLRTVSWALDQQLFPSLNQGQTVMGSFPSRKAITESALSDFYSKHYRPKNAIALFSGNIHLQKAKSILKNAILFPPSTEPLPKAETSSPNVPSEIKQRASGLSVTVGFTMGNTPLQSCKALAALAQMRLYQKVIIDQPLAQTAQVQCIYLRQKLLLIGVAFTNSPSVSDLPAQIENVFTSLRLTPSSKLELKRLRQRERQLKNAPTIHNTERISELAFALGTRGRSLKQVLATHSKSLRFSKKTLTRTAKSRFRPKYRFLLQLSPFEG